MKLTKPMLKAFEQIVKGENTLNRLAHALHKSISWTDIIVNSLEQEGFITKKNNYEIKGSRILIGIANTAHALKMKELIFHYSGISFEGILTESNLLFLTAVSEDWMTTDAAIKLSKISRYSIERTRRGLRNRGVLVKSKNMYKVNEVAWLLLKEFLVAYRNYSTIEGNVKWKYDDEILFEVNDERNIKENATGMYEYKNYGVRVWVISALCITPKRKLSKEEVFIHSLFEVDDPRTLNLALTFYLKNKLNYQKVLPIAMKYGKYTMFDNFAKLVNTKEEKVKLEGLPVFDRKDFIRIANMYGVENV